MREEGILGNNPAGEKGWEEKPPQCSVVFHSPGNSFAGKTSIQTTHEARWI